MSIRLSALCSGVLLVFPLVLSLNEEQQEMVLMLHNTCIAETGASNDAIEKAKKGNFPDDEKFKCYLMCLMIQMGCVDENGVVDVDATIAIIPEEFQDLAAPIIRKCDTQKGSTPCESAWLTHKCYYNENPDAYFLNNFFALKGP
uniref:Odorant-binding protein 6 n=1 Tax=Monochamus alternatus TaxID=192382 RepID=A0A1I9HZL2_MONAT|nr:odorant-binding protein 6 [Monochamus alternatus]